jgi:hypothetical protein
MEPMTFELARDTVKWYGCSGCWGALQMDPDPENPGLYLVKCVACLDETQGYTSQKYIDRRRALSESELREATKVLREIGVLPDPMKGKTQAQKLQELGF